MSLAVVVVAVFYLCMNVDNVCIVGPSHENYILSKSSAKKNYVACVVYIVLPRSVKIFLENLVVNVKYAEVCRECM